MWPNRASMTDSMLASLVFFTAIAIFNWVSSQLITKSTRHTVSLSRGQLVTVNSSQSVNYEKVNSSQCQLVTL
jgi:hypothetical protein